MIWIVLPILIILMFMLGIGREHNIAIYVGGIRKKEKI